jgi:HlyD family secretion protein
MQAPTLFTIAGDLSLMQVNASIDEADIGSIRPKQPVAFTVDAYPDRTFSGHVSQVRLQPTVVQNVTTYITVIDVPNKDLLLKPGMTATVTVKVAEREDVLRVPNAALRFRPTPDVLTALGGDRAAGEQPRRASSDRAKPSSGADADPEPASDWRQATTIDAAFGPVPTPNSRARLWQIRDGRLAPVQVRLGLTDGTTTELIEGSLEAGSSVVTNVALPTGTSTSAQSRSPLLPQFPRAGSRSAGRSR